MGTSIASEPLNLFIIVKQFINQFIKQFVCEKYKKNH